MSKLNGLAQRIFGHLKKQFIKSEVKKPVPTTTRVQNPTRTAAETKPKEASPIVEKLKPEPSTTKEPSSVSRIHSTETKPESEAPALDTSGDRKSVV